MLLSVYLKSTASFTVGGDPAEIRKGMDQSPGAEDETVAFANRKNSAL